MMKRKHFRNKFLKNLTDENRFAYKKQRYFCASLLREELREYFANSNKNNITYKRKFWAIKVFFLKLKNTQIERLPTHTCD